MVRQSDGTTLPGWRDFERAIACVLGGFATESKAIFDVLVPSTLSPTTTYGLSVKSHQLASATAIDGLSTGGRVYMELSNSPAKFWAALESVGINEDEFRNRRKADVIGNMVLDTVQTWHTQAAEQFNRENPGKTLDLHTSAYVVVSYSKPRNNRPIEYQLHSFDLAFPEGIEWSYRSAKCLKGSDPDNPSETLFDWYALSGGQLKYYPKALNAQYCSPKFTLANVTRQIPVGEKAARYWPKEWLAAGGKTDLTVKTYSEELKLHSSLFDNAKAQEIIQKAVEELLKLE